MAKITGSRRFAIVTNSSVDAGKNDKNSVNPDLQLVSAVLGRDRKATAEFVALYADSIYNYFFHRLIPRVDLVEDIFQEVFLSALENLDKFQGISALRSWLLGIARHKVEDYYRARLREPEPFEPEGDEFQSQPDTTPDCEENLDRQSLEMKIRQVLLWRYR
jgi:RNA polymerase sigma factor (sigma-70 family)